MNFKGLYGFLVILGELIILIFAFFLVLVGLIGLTSQSSDTHSEFIAGYILICVGLHSLAFNFIVRVILYGLYEKVEGALRRERLGRYSHSSKSTKKGK